MFDFLMCKKVKKNKLINKLRREKAGVLWCKDFSIKGWEFMILGCAVCVMVKCGVFFCFFFTLTKQNCMVFGFCIDSFET